MPGDDRRGRSSRRRERQAALSQASNTSPRVRYSPHRRSSFDILGIRPHELDPLHLGEVLNALQAIEVLVLRPQDGAMLARDSQDETVRHGEAMLG